jgi:hypothetical protein
MAKTSNVKGMTSREGTQGRRRTKITKVNSGASTRPQVPQALESEATRPVTPGGAKHRGDRRDTSRLYTTNRKHAARGNNSRPDVKTRKR